MRVWVFRAQGLGFPPLRLTGLNRDYSTSLFESLQRTVSIGAKILIQGFGSKKMDSGVSRGCRVTGRSAGVRWVSLVPMT